jgi:hypothetical protein
MDLSTFNVPVNPIESFAFRRKYCDKFRMKKPRQATVLREKPIKAHFMCITEACKITKLIYTAVFD